MGSMKRACGLSQRSQDEANHNNHRGHHAQEQKKIYAGESKSIRRNRKSMLRRRGIVQRTLRSSEKGHGSSEENKGTA